MKFNLFKKNKEYVLPRLEIHLTDHCNLNCNHCGHYAHLVDKEVFTDINQFTKDINELSSKIKYLQIKLLGGEPLLHPDIVKFIEETRKAYPKSSIFILTNGILLPRMNDDFWNAVLKNRIMIELSKYPILSGDTFSSLLDLIDDKRAILGQIYLKKRFYSNLNVEGTSDKVKSFKSCNSFFVNQLWQSKLYSCMACYRKYYNDKYKTNIALPNCADIYNLSAEEIYKTMRKPSEGCRYCFETSKEYEWSQYKK